MMTSLNVSRTFQSQQSVYKGSLPSYSDSFFIEFTLFYPCLLAIFSLAPYNSSVHFNYSLSLPLWFGLVILVLLDNEVLMDL
jgi:hypothetical protein